MRVSPEERVEQLMAETVRRIDDANKLAGGALLTKNALLVFMRVAFEEITRGQEYRA